MPTNTIPRPTGITLVIAAYTVFATILGLIALFRPSFGSVLACAITAGIAVALHVRPGTASRVAASIVAVSWGMTIIALIFAGPILYALWNKEANRYYEDLRNRREQQALYPGSL